jgi:hypothetical protein
MFSSIGRDSLSGDEVRHGTGRLWAGQVCWLRRERARCWAGPGCVGTQASGCSARRKATMQEEVDAGGARHPGLVAAVLLGQMRHEE